MTTQSLSVRCTAVILVLILALQGQGGWALMMAAEIAVRAPSGPRPLHLMEMATIRGGDLPEDWGPDCTNNDPPHIVLSQRGREDEITMMDSHWVAVPPIPVPSPAPPSGEGIGDGEFQDFATGAPGGGEGQPDLGAPVPGRGVGDPIDVSTGWVFRRAVDVSLPVQGDLFFGLHRTYSESYTNSDVQGVQGGMGWRHSPDLRLYTLQMWDGQQMVTTEDVVFRNQEGGLRNFFYSADDGVYYSQLDQGFYARLVNVGGTEPWRMTLRGGVEYRFDENGLLTRVTDRNGNYLTHHRDSAGRLVRIENSGDARQLRFEYHAGGFADGQLWRVTNAAGTPYVTYEYSEVANPWDDPFVALTTVTYGADSRVEYRYTVLGDDLFAHHRLRMERVIDARGDTVVRWNYEPLNLGAGVTFSGHPRANEIAGSGAMLVDYMESPQQWYESSYSEFLSSASVRSTYTLNWSRDVLRITDGNVHHTSVSYLEGSNQSGARPSQRLVHVSEDALGRLTTHVYDAISQSDTYVYDYVTPSDHFRQPNCIAVTYPTGEIATWAYSADDLCMVTSARDRLGRHTRILRDTFGNPTTVMFSDGTMMTCTYDSHGQMTALRDRQGGITTFAFSPTGSLQDMVDTHGCRQRWLFDSDGRPSVHIDPLGNHSTLSYDALGRLARVDLPTGHFMAWEHDAAGNVSSVRNARGFITTYSHDSGGRPLVRRDALGGITRWGYDRAGNLTTQTDALGHVTTWGYDNRGNMTVMRNAAGHFATYAHNVTGGATLGEMSALACHRNMRGELATLMYDERDHLAALLCEGGASISCEHSDAGQLTILDDSLLNLGSGVHMWTYDDDHRLVRELAPDGAVLSYTYDGYGRRQSIVDPDGNVTCHIYTEGGLLHQIRNGFGQVTTHSYDSFGRLISRENWNGTSATRGYDSRGRVNDLVHRLGDGGLGLRIQYAFDANGNVVRTTYAADPDDSWPDQVVLCTYDALDRLTSEAWNDWSNEDGGMLAPRWQRNCVYDAVGNRTALGYFNGSTTATVTYSYNSLNQLTLMSSGAYRHFRYDANGNLIARTTELNGNEGWFYIWTQDDRMARAYLVLDEKVGEHRGTTFVYDVSGRRILRQDDDGTWTRYFHDGLNVLLERESNYHPSTWSEFIAMDAEDGSTGEWLTNATTTVSNAWNDDRMGRVIQTGNPTAGSAGAMVPGTYNWDESNKTVTMAIQRAESGIWTVKIQVTISLSPAMTIALYYDSWHTTVSEFQPGHISIGVGNPLGGSSATESDWWVLSRDLQADVHQIYPNYSVIDVDSITIQRNDLRVDDIHLGDAQTTRICTLAPSALGGIISERHVAEIGSNADTWYHCDRRGNVVLTTDSNGDSNGLRWQDAFGNELASLATGSWALPSTAEGLGLLSREFDGDVEMYLLNDGWCSPASGYIAGSPPPNPFNSLANELRPSRPQAADPAAVPMWGQAYWEAIQPAPEDQLPPEAQSASPADRIPRGV